VTDRNGATASPVRPVRHKKTKKTIWQYSKLSSVDSDLQQRPGRNTKEVVQEIHILLEGLLRKGEPPRRGPSAQERTSKEKRNPSINEKRGERDLSEKEEGRKPTGGEKTIESRRPKEKTPRKHRSHKRVSSRMRGGEANATSSLEDAPIY